MTDTIDMALKNHHSKVTYVYDFPFVVSALVPSDQIYIVSRRCGVVLPETLTRIQLLSEDEFDKILDEALNKFDKEQG